MRRLGHDVDTTHNERLDGLPDAAVWEAVESWAGCVVSATEIKIRVRRIVTPPH
ncbi:MAG: hypothetical protein KJ579_10885 [Verrucomicrobia bacterium]|nr:hypothetical protein [Verrucomicrobiota bacterium]